MQKKKATLAKNGEEKLIQKYEKSLLRASTPAKTKKETRRVTELKNPTALTMDEQAEERLLSPKRKRVEGAFLMPNRESESRETLAIKAIHPQVESTEKPLYAALLDINRELHRTRNNHTLPLEELASLNILSSEFLSVDEKQTQFSREIAQDTNLIAAQLLQLHQTPANETLRLACSQNVLDAHMNDTSMDSKKKKKKVIEQQTNVGEACLSSVIKLSMAYGQFGFTFGYEKRNLPESRDDIFEQFDTDREIRRLAFFANDQIETETPFHLKPTRYKMFRQLLTENLHKYKSRDTMLQNATRNLPRESFDEVSREYIVMAQQRPGAHDETCMNGQHCVCYTFSSDPLARYVGKRFYTEEQCEQVKRGEPLTQNIEGLCIHCLFRKWTREQIENISRSRVPERPINYFTVKVGPGQYSRRCMLDVDYNGIPTGIVCHIPRFDPTNLEVVIAHRRNMEHSLDKGNTCLGFAKLRPLNGCALAEERVAACHFKANLSYTTERAWISQLQLVPHPSIVLERHYLAQLEQRMCIASLEQGNYVFHSIDGLRIILAHHTNNTLNVRELPVSLLRLYFSGLQHFERLYDAMPLVGFDTLVNISRRDGFTNLRTYLSFVLDATFCSFERTLVMMARATDRHETWPDVGLMEALEEDVYFKQCPLPETLISVNLRQTRLIWYAVLWRVNVTLMVEKWWKPWLTEMDKEWLLYRMQLFRDTHLELFAIMSTHNMTEDTLLFESGMLTLYWPLPDRVCCLEELPNLSEYALDNLKNGTKLKQRHNLYDKVGHFFFNKTMNHKCMNRNFAEILRRYGEQDELIYDLTKVITRCSLLGNMPRARGALIWMSRVRTIISFWPEHADREMTRGEIYATMPASRNPFELLKLRRGRRYAKLEAKGWTKEVIENDLANGMPEENYTKTVFKMWLLANAYFTSALIKEYIFGILEKSLILDEFYSVDCKWTRYKEIRRIGNGYCRNELSSQTTQHGIKQPFDWLVVEFVEKSRQCRYDIKRGASMAFHALTIKVFSKVMKRDFMGIIISKAIATDGNFSFDLDEVPKLYQTALEADEDLMTLEELDLMCWHIAKSPGQEIETRWFQVMGMSSEGLDELRNWLFEFYRYEVADDAYKQKIENFRRRSFKDYLLMMIVFILVSHYRKVDWIFPLPLPVGKRQAHALRAKLLQISDHEPTPPRLGKHYECRGCCGFANAVVLPLTYTTPSNYCELMRPNKQIYIENRSTRPHLNGRSDHSLILNLQNQSHIVEFYQSQLARASQSKNTKSINARLSKETVDEKIVKDELKRRKDNISFLTVAFYNIMDGQAYCVRNRRRRILSSRGTDESNTVMRYKPTNTRVESSKFNPTAVKHEPRSTDSAVTEEAEDECLPGSNEEEEATLHLREIRPSYEDNPLAMNPDTDDPDQWEAVLRHYSEQRRTGSSKSKPLTQKEINKRNIANIVNAPLHKLHNCRQALREVDMIGLVKNGYVLCVECGVMTLYETANTTSRGPDCLCRAQANMTTNHPVWDIDTQTTNVLAKVRATEFFSAKQLVHLNDRLPAYPHEFYRCHFCGKQGAALQVPCYDEFSHLTKQNCCRACHRTLRGETPNAIAKRHHLYPIHLAIHAS